MSLKLSCDCGWSWPHALEEGPTLDHLIDSHARRHNKGDWDERDHNVPPRRLSAVYRMTTTLADEKAVTG